MRTRIFKNGNSQAVRIPAEIAYDETEAEFEIRREGDTLIIAPVKRSPAEILRQLKPLPDFMSGGRGDQEQKNRDPL